MFLHAYLLSNYVWYIPNQNKYRGLAKRKRGRPAGSSKKKKKTPAKSVARKQPTKGRKKRKRSGQGGEDPDPDPVPEDQLTDDDDDLLHGVCGESLVGADANPNDCLIGKYVAKIFLPDDSDDDRLYTGTVTQYDQKTKKFTIIYHADKYIEKCVASVVHKLRKTFEKWYAKVSVKGQRFTRKQALPIVCKAYDNETQMLKAKLGAPIDLTAYPAPGQASKDQQIKLALSIKAMKVVALRRELNKVNMNSSGLKSELQERLADHYKVTLPGKESKGEPGKHKAAWSNKELKVTPTKFTDQGFNETSLQGKLAGFPDRVPEPWKCHNFFVTDDMWELGLEQINLYPKTLAATQTRPPWTPERHPWPPKWTDNPHTFTMPEYQHYTMTMHLLGVKRCGKNNLRTMFSNDEMLQEPWLKRSCSRLKMEAFLRQLHFEDGQDPFGERYPHSINYRPNGVPKVGLYAEKFRRQCVLFRPSKDLSFDEATAKYGGRMTRLKHLQTRYKPYDGIRVYSLNASDSGYTQNFRVDLRDGTQNGTMLKSCVAPFEGCGYNVWGDNAFVSVEMLKYFREHGVNFAGTSRTTFGFPESLIDEDLSMGQWKWQMAPPGLLAAFWCDVGFVKLMSNFHSPKGGMVLRRVKGKADREARDAPVVGEQYNTKMGGVDLKDMMRGVYTVARQGKKWWKTLWYWVLDASMYNAMVLHKWCHYHKHPDVAYKFTYREFIRAVCGHYIMSPDPKAASASKSTCRQRVVAPRKSKRKLLASPDVQPVSKRAAVANDSVNGCSVDARVVSASHINRTPIDLTSSRKALSRRDVCPGAGLVKRDVFKKKAPTQVLGARCKFHYNRGDTPVRKTTIWMCKQCKAPLCVECDRPYHDWIRSAQL